MAEDIAQGHVQGHMSNRQPVAVQEHGKPPRPGPLSEDFGVAGVGEPGGAQPLLVQRCRDDAVSRSLKCPVDGSAEIIVGGPAGGSTDPARSDRVQILVARPQTGDPANAWLDLAGTM